MQLIYMNNNILLTIYFFLLFNHSLIIVHIKHKYINLTNIILNIKITVFLNLLYS